MSGITIGSSFSILKEAKESPKVKNPWLSSEKDQHRGLQDDPPPLARILRACIGGKDVGGADSRTMEDDGHANAVIVSMLKACAKQKDLERGIRIHDDIVRRQELEADVYVGSALAHMYARCGELGEAQEVFGKLLVRDVSSWNVLIAGYAQHGCGEEALQCYERMLKEGLSPNPITFVYALKACGNIRDSQKGQELHGMIIGKGLLEKNIMVGNALVDMYAKCGELGKAREVFHELGVRDVVSWNTLITGYAQHGHREEALDCFEQMQQEGFCPTSVTYLSTLKACGSNGNMSTRGSVPVRMHERIHERLHVGISSEGLLKKDALLGSALVDTYAKCGDLVKARAVFDNEVLIRNVVSWTALITAYSQYGLGEEALECFEQMQKEGYAPNSVTFACVLKACGSIRAQSKGIQVHADLIREGLLQRDVLLGTALVDMYAKCGDLTKAQQTFNDLQNRDVVAWNALISGYAQHGHGEEALCCFRHMRLDNVPPNAVTFVCILKACGILGASGKGQEIHTAIIRGQFLQENVILGYALVDMYAKCGALTKAREVFDELPLQDVVAWNGLISGYAQLGAHEVVFGAFDEMIGKGVEPTAVTFTALLNACSHSGLLEKGKVYFDMMSLRYGIIPTLEHHTCMVDLFSRAGIVDKAMTIMSEMQFPADLAMCHSLLSACGRWGNVNVGRLAFQHAVQLDEQDVGAYVCLGNMYASCDGKSPTEIADWKLANKVGIERAG